MHSYTVCVQPSSVTGDDITSGEEGEPVPGSGNITAVWSLQAGAIGVSMVEYSTVAYTYIITYPGRRL